MNTNFPTISFKELFHVGTMDVNDKEHGSLEGNGLSVSLCPHEWRRITSLKGDLYALKKENNMFLNFHKLKQKQKEIIIQYGINEEYIEPCKIYRVYFCDENSDDVYFSFDNYDKAKREAEAEDPDDYENSIKAVNGYKANDKMKERVLNKCEPNLVLDLLSTIYTEDVLKLDGVYWDDDLDVYNYSAPRGVINLTNLKNWNIKLENIL